MAQSLAYIGTVNVHSAACNCRNVGAWGAFVLLFVERVYFAVQADLGESVLEDLENQAFLR